MESFWWGALAGAVVAAAFGLLIFQQRQHEFLEAIHRKKSDAARIAHQRETIQTLVDERATFMQGIES